MLYKSYSTQNFLSFLLFIAAVVCWIYFAPVNIGGNTTYAILRGNSMYSEFKQGDLVLVHKKNSYAVGDIILYKNPDVGPIFHRIIGMDGENFFLKGDNNSWVDSYQPSVQDVYGSLWLHLSNVGYLLKLFRSPTIFSLIITFSCILIGNSFSNGQGKLSANAVKDISFMDKSRTSKMTYKQSDWLYFFIVLLLCAIVLAFIAFSKPIERSIPDDLSYTNHGSFEYSAVTPHDVYKEGYLESGDTVFRLLTDSLNLIFHYHLESEYPTQITGSLQLLAEVSDATGWAYPIEITPATNFNGPDFTISGIIELNQIQEIIDNLEKQTGVNNAAYYLNIKPDVHLRGVIANREFEDDFSPILIFTIDNLTMKLPHKNDDALNDLLNPSSQGVLNGTRSVANTISFWGIDFNVLFLRMVSIYGIVFSFILLAWFGNKYLGTQNQNEITKIKLQFGITFIDIKDSFFLAKNAIEIENLKELATIAAREQSTIYHRQLDTSHHYYVISQNNSDVIYHCQISINTNRPG